MTIPRRVSAPLLLTRVQYRLFHIVYEHDVQTAGIIARALAEKIPLTEALEEFHFSVIRIALRQFPRFEVDLETIHLNGNHTPPA